MEVVAGAKDYTVYIDMYCIAYQENHKVNQNSYLPIIMSANKKVKSKCGYLKKSIILDCDDQPFGL